LNANTIIVTTATLQDSDKPTEIQQAALDVLLSNFLDLLLSHWTMCITTSLQDFLPVSSQVQYTSFPITPYSCTPGHTSETRATFIPDSTSVLQCSSLEEAFGRSLANNDASVSCLSTPTTSREVDSSDVAVGSTPVPTNVINLSWDTLEEEDPYKMDLEEYYCFHSLQAHHLYDSLRFYPGLQAADSLEQIHKTRLDSIEEEDPYSMLLDEYHYLWGLHTFGDSMLARLTRKFQWLRLKQADAQFKEVAAEPCMDSEDYFLRDIYEVHDITIEQRIKLKFHLLHQAMSSQAAGKFDRLP